ncbi:tyrosine-type recombinase/integrase [Lederbergia lenta]|uniref:tyrosine-type recombinase/integrase n=1 Tax=Lederbergia lenta TaxID=1467 RepID=UPI0020407F92|nr:tyrosine-type recombinase/integrase [Lederbergia lenta]MCM3109943.1 tyrosine-type recombinase/integrase [Lederbergia lenta]
MLADKVVRLNTPIYDQIILFLDKKFMYSGSQSTKDAYKRDIIHFFNYLTKGKKEIYHLNNEDIRLQDDDIIQYQIYLKNSLKLANKSINRKISPIFQLYGRFMRKGMVKNISPFDEADRLKEGKNYHGVLSVEEVSKMADLVLNEPRARKRLTKHYLILFAMDTCLRKQALLDLEWTDFIVFDDEVEIKAIDKGNEERNLRISREFYNELLQLKSESKTGKVFDISETSIQTMMNKLNKWMNFEEKRNIVFHSIRKAGVTFQFRLTNDIFQAKKASGHKNMENLMIYIGEREYGVLGAVSSSGKIDNELYKNVSYEKLIKGIESLNKDQILLLNLKLNEIN